MNDDEDDANPLTPTGEAVKAVEQAAAAYLEAIGLHCPEGRTTALARAKLKESLMWALKGFSAS